MEESVDVDMVSAVCPNCHIMMIEADTSNLTDLGYSIEEAVALGAHVVSTSWGNTEFSGETGNDYFFNDPGVMITVGSGDGAYVAGTQYPAASPWVTAVGATSPVPASNKRGWTESVWYFPNNNPPNGTSSGCSIDEGRKESWQKDTGCTTRMIGDVSAVGNSVAGYDTYGVSPGWYYFFGTSVASPVIAGVYGLANNATKLNYGSQSYMAPAGVWDVVKGNNGTCPSQPAYFCNAEKGYDGPTGNGTPHGLPAF
jgi:subtilase family serine protease